jgi:hypothetical protein
LSTACTPHAAHCHLLPALQACRRQAPAWLVSSLLSAFPKSAYHTTQFSELPLHLAVESGAAPEVVNLIMVANWSAIVTPDNSGRIPTDILDRGELLLLDDHRIVHESLLRCHESYTAMQNSAHDEQAAIKSKHSEQMTTIQRQHQESLKREQEKQEEIQEEVAALQSKIDEMKRVEAAKDVLVEEAKKETRAWQQRAKKLSSAIHLLEEELARENKQIALLTKKLEDEEEEISDRDDMIDILSNDLRAIYKLHDTDLMDSVRQAEQTMRAMVSSQIALQKQLTGQASGIKELICSRGIDIQHSHKEVVQEEKDPHDEQDSPHQEVGTHEVADALAAAAINALKPDSSII